MLILLFICAIVIAMKKETLHKRLMIANDSIYYIYTHIEKHIDIDELSQDFVVSKLNMQRIFKEAFGKNIYESIKSIRLKKPQTFF